MSGLHTKHNSITATKTKRVAPIGLHVAREDIAAGGAGVPSDLSYPLGDDISSEVILLSGGSFNERGVLLEPSGVSIEVYSIRAWVPDSIVGATVALWDPVAESILESKVVDLDPDIWNEVGLESSHAFANGVRLLPALHTGTENDFYRIPNSDVSNVGYNPSGEVLFIEGRFEGGEGVNYPRSANANDWYGVVDVGYKIV